MLAIPNNTNNSNNICNSKQHLHASTFPHPLIILSILTRRHVLQSFEISGEGQNVFVAYGVGYGGDGEFGVTQEVFCLVDAVFGDVLVESYSCVVFEHFAEVVFGETYVTADGVDIDVVFVVFFDVADGGVDGGVLGGEHVFGVDDVQGDFVKAVEHLVD